MQASKRLGGGAAQLFYMSALGVCGGVLRGLELGLYFDWNKVLFAPFATAFLLPAWSVLAVLSAAAIAYTRRGQVGDYLHTYGLRGKASLVPGVLSAAGLTLAGAMKIFSALATARFAHLIFGVLTVLCGFAFLALLHARYRRCLTEMTRLFATVPIYWACFLLVLTFMEHPVEPVLRVFAYDLLASCALLLSLYYESAHVYGKGRQALAVFSYCCTIYFAGVSVLGRVVAFLISGETYALLDAPFRMAVYACVGLALYFNAARLLRAPTREPGAPEDENRCE